VPAKAKHFRSKPNFQISFQGVHDSIAAFFRPLAPVLGLSAASASHSSSSFRSQTMRPASFGARGLRKKAATVAAATEGEEIESLDIE
jgi:hypothetical protein